MTVQLMKIAGLLVLILFSYTISAQTVVKGTLKEKTAAGESPLPFANVFLKGTTTGAITNIDGEYTFLVEAGNHTIVFSFVGYNPVEKSFEATGEGEVKINATLSMNNSELQEVTIKGRANRESENLLMMEQKKAVIAVESIGAVELSRKGISDVASGVKKITGVSMMGSNQLFVRGLGDRYNSAELNGLPIVSPDPTKKLIKLDIFPSDVVQNLGINKVFSASTFADYTGALINIETKDYPNKPFFNIEVGGKYNSQSTGKEFRRIEADGNTFMGFDVNARASQTPSDYKIINRILPIDNDKFNYNNFGFTTDNALPNLSLSIKGGKLFQLNEKRKLGVVAAVSFDNEYETRPDVLDISTNRQNNKKSTFTSQEYTYKSLFTSLVSLSYIPNSKNTIKYTSIFLNNGEDLLKEKTGISKDWGEDNTALIRNAQYINYRLLSNQLFGKHTISEKLKIDWAAQVMEVGYNMPDRREIVYTSSSDNEWKIFLLNNGNDTKRIVLEQDAMDYSAKTNLTYDLNNKRGSVKIGAATRYKEITLNSYLYGYEYNTDANTNLNIDTDNPNAYLTSSTINKIKNNTSDDMGYLGDASVHAAFVDFVYNFRPNLTFNVGVRAEQSDMTVTSNTIKISGNEKDYSFSNLDFFPAVNIKYSRTSKTNLRLSLSRTITRPSFYEKSPVSVTPELGDRRTFGNVYTKDNPKDDGTYLENSYSNNIDIKYEFFPTAGELISIGGYFKEIEEPIEKISVISGGEINYTFRNFIENAYAAGLEFEIKKKFNNLFTGLNASYIYTHITVPEKSSEIDTERELQGASPYLINADLGYQFNYNTAKTKSSYLGITYNVYGKRLYTVGVSGSSNQYELPFHSVDMVLKNKLGKHFEINASVKNILNQYVEYVQDVYENVVTNEKTGTQTFKQYKKGITAGINITYKF